MSSEFWIVYTYTSVEIVTVFSYPALDNVLRIDAEVKECVEQAKMETDDPSENGTEESDDQAYQDLLAQKAALEAELQEIINELQPLKVQLEALDKSIAEDEAELPILEAAMMEEVREFLGEL